MVKKDELSKIAICCFKLIPHNFVSVLVKREVSDEDGTRDVFVSVAGDEVSTAEIEQEQIRTLVLKGNSKLNTDTQPTQALVIPINPEAQAENNDLDNYYLYLQSLAINPKDVKHVREIFNFAIEKLTRSSISSYNAGVVHFEDLHAFEMTEPKPVEYQYVEGEAIPVARPRKRLCINREVRCVREWLCC